MSAARLRADPTTTSTPSSAGVYIHSDGLRLRNYHVEPRRSRGHFPEDLVFAIRFRTFKSQSMPAVENLKARNLVTVIGAPYSFILRNDLIPAPRHCHRRVAEPG